MGNRAASYQLLHDRAVLLRGMAFKADEIEATLQVSNRVRCNPPLPESEVTAIAVDVCRLYKPAGIPKWPPEAGGGQ